MEIVLQTETFKHYISLSKLHESARKMFPGTFGKVGFAAILCAIVFVGLRALFQHAHGKVFFGATICLIGFIEIVLQTDTFKHDTFKRVLDLFRSLSDGGTVGCAAILCAIVFFGLRALFQHAHGKVFFGATICLIGLIVKRALDLFRSLSDGSRGAAPETQSIDAQSHNKPAQLVKALLDLFHPQEESSEAVAFSMRARSVSAALQSMNLTSLLKQFQEQGLDDEKVLACTDLLRYVPDLARGNTYAEFARQFKLSVESVHEMNAQEFYPGTKELIGEGSFGQVFKMRHVACGFVAVKESHGSVISSDREAVIRELQKMRALLASKHVVKCLGQVVGLSDSKMGIVLELLECDVGDRKVYNMWELLRSMRKGGIALSWAEKVHVCLGVAQGLSDIHAKKMLHRDLKLENVLVGGVVGGVERSNQPLCIKIADFGESMYVQDLALENAAVTRGTSLRICAPELLGDAAPVYSLKSDSYALGIFIWEVVKGGRAYGLDDIEDQNADDERIKQMVLKGEGDDYFHDFFDEQQRMPEGSQQAFKTVITLCWKRNPDERPTASDVVTSLMTLKTQLAQP
jgi:hypothetical protein